MSKGSTTKPPTHYTDQTGNRWAHGDRMWEMYREAWFVGNVTKYVTRYKLKDGIKDLHKAKDYLTKLISLEKEELDQDGIKNPRSVSMGINYLEMSLDILDKLIEHVESVQDLPLKQEVVNVVHRQQEDITDKTYCGLTPSNGITTTNVPALVNCKDCIQVMRNTIEQYYSQDDHS